MTKYVTYFRVSTQKQGLDGLGVTAQKAAVGVFLKPSDTVVAEFVEVESGRSNDRPQLAAALRLARQRKCTLLIARLDRLSRRVSFLSALMDSGVEFIAVDNPNATRFTLHILAAVAEHEAAMISARTKAALAAAKARGVLLGGARGVPMLQATRDAGCAAVARAARKHAMSLADVVADLRAKGVHTATAIADALNELGMPTPRNGKWHPASAARLLHHACPLSSGGRGLN